MIARTLFRRLGAVLADFGAARGGIAAVEFALILPVMLVLYLGGIEISQEVSVARLTSLTASTVANLVRNTRWSAQARPCPTSSTPPRRC